MLKHTPTHIKIRTSLSHVNWCTTSIYLVENRDSKQKVAIPTSTHTHTQTVILSEAPKCELAKDWNELHTRTREARARYIRTLKCHTVQILIYNYFYCHTEIHTYQSCWLVSFFVGSAAGRRCAFFARIFILSHTYNFSYQPWVRQKVALHEWMPRWARRQRNGKKSLFTARSGWWQPHQVVWASLSELRTPHASFQCVCGSAICSISFICRIVHCSTIPWLSVCVCVCVLFFWGQIDDRDLAMR